MYFQKMKNPNRKIQHLNTKTKWWPNRLQMQECPEPSKEPHKDIVLCYVDTNNYTSSNTHIYIYIC